MSTITVLAIDGGGIRGMIPAAFLNKLEQQTGHPVSELFDYVAGTSTGGIIALALGPVVTEAGDSDLNLVSVPAFMPVQRIV